MTDKDLLIKDLRISIDNLDRSFMRLLSERMRLTERILDVKKLHKIDYTKSEARQEDIQKLSDKAKQMGMDPIFLEFFFKALFTSAMERFQNVSHQVIDIGEYGIKLSELRESLYNVELAILTILTERFKVVRRIGHVKALNKIPALDQARWSRLMEEKISMAMDMDLSQDLVESIFEEIHQVALRLENDMIATND